MRILYLDCFSGISGDMMVGALADLGVTPSTFEWELSNLEIGDYHLHFKRETRRGISGVKFAVHSGATHVDHHDHSHGHEAHDHDHGDHYKHESPDGHGEHSHAEIEHHHGHFHNSEHSSGYKYTEFGRSFSELNLLLSGSELSSFVKQHAISIFRRIAEAKAKIHGVPTEEVQFHEVGSIVDVVLTCIGMETFKVEQVHFSELVDGTGTVCHPHGSYSLPAPVTLEILRDLPIRQIPLPVELITPTGAAIVAEFQHSVGPMPRNRPSKVGYGLGIRDFAEHPNVLRAVLADLTANAGTN